LRKKIVMFLAPSPPMNWIGLIYVPN